MAPDPPASISWAQRGWGGRRTTAPDGFDDLREALETFVPTKPGAPPDPVRIGHKLRALKGRVVDGHKLHSDAARASGRRWRVTDA